MPSVTTWARLEPRCRSEAIDRGIEARVFDPLWMLARQWQFGEFRGEDAGSPAVARFRMEVASINRYRLGRDGANRTYDGRLPLEALVEREPVRETARSFRIAAQAGLHWLRLLRSAGVKAATMTAYGDELALEMSPSQQEVADHAGRAFISVTRRVPDGVLLYERLRKWRRRSAAATLPGIAAAGSASERTKVAGRVETWLKWYDGMFSEPQRKESAWLADRMEYQFAVGGNSASGEVVLEAPEYHGGHLDWYAFESGSRSLEGPAVSRASVITHTVVPSPATFRGMPAARWWEFEDSQIDFGSVDAEPDDLARLVLMEFALIYGNDWFVIPVEVPLGTICIPRSLVVTDTFGIRTLVHHHSRVDGPASPWRMFELTTAGPSRGNLPGRELFFLPPTLAGALQASPLEEVLFVRDEMANMAWAIERVIEGLANQPVRRFELSQQRIGQAGRPVDGGARTESDGRPSALRYRLATEVPGYWIPLLPERTADESIQLRRGSLLRQDGSRAAVQALGRILVHGEKSVVIFDEEVPRSGVRVTRGFRYARWIDGSSCLWLARQKQIGRGEGSSGLRFDVAERSG